MYDGLDFNGDEEINLQEFTTFVEAAKLIRQHKVKKIDEKLSQALKDKIADLFDLFDADGNGKISAEEIYRTFLSIGIKRSIQQIKEMINKMNSDSKELGKSKFIEMMVPFF